MQQRTLGFLLTAGIFGAIFLTHFSSLTIASSRLQTAAVFFVESIDPGVLKTIYRQRTLTAETRTETLASAAAANNRPIRILIVPGHEPDFGGTQFDGVYERDVVVTIADKLAAYLSANKHYTVMVARGATAWNPALQVYFDTHEKDIVAFQQQQQVWIVT